MLALNFTINFSYSQDIVMMGDADITTCDAIFYDSGALANYSNNENQTITFTSANGSCIRAVIDNFDLEDGSDYLYIYDGTDITGNQIDVITGNSVGTVTDWGGTAYFAQSGSITFRFTSDGSTTGDGWQIKISCPENCIAPSTTQTVPASDYCSTPTPICDFNGYYGNTSSSYTSGSVPSAFCGSVENNSWLSFMADSTTAILDVWVWNGSSGIQLQVYETTDCSSFTAKSNCWSTGHCWGDGSDEQAGQIVATGLTVGNTYLLMIDGFGGDDCEYVFAASSGVVATDAGADQTICEGQTVSLSATGGTTYSWTSNPEDDTYPSWPQTSQTITVSPDTTTVYTVTATGSNPDCPGVDQVVVRVTGSDADFNGLDPAFCDTDGTVSLVGNPQPGSFVGDGISGSDFDPAAAGLGSHDITYTYKYDVVNLVTDDFSAGNVNGWTLDPNWTMGQATSGCTGKSEPFIDASTGNDNMILGNPVGDCYANSIVGTQWATSPVINCSGIYNVHLSFNRWLSIESNTYDEAVIEVYDGSSWQQIYANPSSIFEDIEWMYIDYNVSAYADNNSNFQVRFGVGPTDASTTYAGFHIDDFSVYGVQQNNSGACTSVETKSTTVNPSPTASFTVDAGICLYDSATVTFTGSAGGSAAYNWDFDGGTAVPGTGVGPHKIKWNTTGTKTITLTVTENSCSSAEASEQVEVYDIPNSDFTYLASSCQGDSIEIEASQSGNTYTWDFDGGGANPGGDNQGPHNVAWSTTGTKDVQLIVENADGCYDTTNHSIVVNEMPLSDFTATDPNCASSNSDIEYTGGFSGAGTFTWDFDGGTINSGSGSGPYEVSWITPGSKTISLVIDSDDGCTSDTTKITITVPESVVADSVVVEDVTCYNGSNGTITVYASGGTTPYQYSKDGSTYVNDNEFTGLSQGLYPISIRDANGCILNYGDVSISQPNDITITGIDHTDITCNGDDDGTITINGASGGTPSYEYSIDGSNYQASNDFDPVTPGDYDIYIRDDNNCVKNVGSATIDEPEELTILSVSSDPIDCNGETTIITITADGGTTNYEYTITGGAPYYSNNQFTSVSGGNHTVIVRDANGCTTAPQIHNVSEPSAIAYTHSETAASCGVANGSARVTPSGGTPASGASPYTYQWNDASSQTDSIATGLLSGPYSCTITDGNGCQTVASINVPSDNGGTVAITSTTNVLCHGLSTGEATAEITGGVSGSYDFVWTTSPAGDTVRNQTGTANLTDDITGLSAGNYVVTMTDGNCTSSESFTITEPDTLRILQITYDDILCNGDNNGEIHIIASGGTGSIDYSIDDNNTTQNNGDFVGLSTAGNDYITVVTDDNGCSKYGDTITIAEPAALALDSLIENDVTCNGANNGSIIVYISGGTKPYQYSKNGGISYQSDSIFSGLMPDDYDITVRDANNCAMVVGTYTIDEPEEIDIYDVSTSNVICNGDNDGTITIHVTGGTPSYEYSINGGSSYQNDSVFNSLAPGSYSIRVSDTNGCIEIGNTINITQPSEITIVDIDYTNVSCYGGSNGTIDIVANGGYGSLEYSINDGSNYQGSGHFAGLDIDGNDYITVVQDEHNCTVYGDTITITQPDSISVQNVIVTNVSCNGNDNGSIQIVATGGTAPLQYSNDGGSNYQSSANFNNLAPGDYDIFIKDVNNCIKDLGTFTITEPDVLVIDSVLTTNVDCYGSNNAGIIVYASGGSDPYQYSIYNGTSGTYQSDSSFTGLNPNTYTPVVKDTNGCIATGNAVTITQPNRIEIVSINTEDISCNGADDGEVSVIVSGGTPPLEYSIDNGNTYQGTGNFIDLSQGDYTIIIRDANNCFDTTNTITIDEPTELQLDSINYSPILCSGESNGQIQIYVSGGTPQYTYSVDNANTFQSNNTFNNLGDGTYYVVVMDDNRCIVYGDTIQFINPPAFTVDVVGTDLLCNDDNSGKAVATANGGTQPYTYSWNTTPAQTTDTAFNLSAGNYQITVIDSNNCEAINTITINEPDALIINAVPSHTTCGAANGSVTAVVSGGTQPYDYSWSTGSINASITNLSAGAYTIEVTDSNSCVESEVVNINNTDGGVASISDTTMILCYGQNTGEATATITGGTSPFDFVWTLNNDTISSVENTTDTDNSVSNLEAGTYVVTITEDNGCAANASITITQPDTLRITDVQTNDIDCNGNANGEITISIDGGTEPIDYSIDNGTTFYEDSSYYNNLPQDTYEIIVQDENGCTTVGPVVTINEPTEIIIDSVVTVQPLCYGDAGRITIYAHGGNGGLSYSVDGGSNYQTGSTFSGLPGGNYNIQVKDQNNCIATTTAAINSPSQLVIDNVSHTDITCNGYDDGTITIVANGGTAPLNYSIDNGNNFVQNGGSFTNVSPDDYVLIVTDANGCSKNAGNVSIDEPDGITILNVSYDDIQCYNDGNATITIIASGGAGNLEYSIGGAYQDTNYFGGLTSGVYPVSVQDTNGCIQTGNQVTIVDPAPISSDTVIVLNIDCYNNANGYIEIDASGGMPPLSYSIDGGVNYQSNNSFNNLTHGSYHIIVKDANGCTLDLGNENITQPNAGLSLSMTKQNVLCYGDTTGMAIVSVNGGTQPYTYSWNTTPAQTNDTAINLAVGNYSVTVTDSNGCQSSENVVIQQSSEIVVNVNSLPATCGACNGSISATVGGGHAPYSYLWINASGNPTGDTTSAISGLCQGVYNVIVTDDYGCEVSQNAIVQNPGNLAISQDSIIHVLCNGGDDGEAYLSVSGGSTPYTWVWPTPANTDSFATGLEAGAYPVTVVDGNGCRSSVIVNITEPSVLEFRSITVEQILCFGDCTGEIFVIPQGGTPPYDFNWIPTGETTQGIDSLCPGYYMIEVSDGHNCAIQDSILIGEPDTIVYIENTIINNVLCYGESTGSATVVPTGGSGDYIFEWNTNPIQTDSTAIGLAAGTYHVTVFDANGCAIGDSIDIQITQPSDSLTAYLSKSDILCFGNMNGEVIVHASGGSGSYYYEWNFPHPSDSIVSNLPAANYCVKVTDANGCQNDSVYLCTTVTQPPSEFEANIIDVTDVLCYGDNTGEIIVSGNGGSGNYNYQWNTTPVQTDSIISNMPAGSYCVDVTDANGCEDTIHLCQVIDGPAAAIDLISNTIVTDVLCNGDSSGSIVVSPTGGSGLYHFVWSAPLSEADSNSTNSTVNGLIPGSYTVTVTDANGCSDVFTNTVQITEPNELIATITDSTDNACFGQNQGSATVSVNGGVGSYTYVWNTTPTQTNATATGLTHGTYCVTVTDTNSCVDVACVTITQPATPVSIIGTPQQNVLCNGDSTGTATVIANGGTPPYTYAWSTTPAQTDSVATNIPAGTITVQITDANGCVETQVYIITEPDPIQLLAVVDSAKCGLPNGSIDITGSGGTGYYMNWTYNWNDPDAQTSNTATGLVGNATYTVTATDINGCTETKTVYIGDNDEGEAAFIPDPTDGQAPFEVNFTNNSIDADSCYWYFGDSTSLITDGNDNPQHLYTEKGEYDVMLIIVTENGCTDTAYYTYINVLPATEFLIPTVFSPNDDGKNDLFYVVGEGLESVNCQIINRWGQVIFQTENLKGTWDGRTITGTEAPDGVYMYIIKIKGINGEIYERHGSITLVR